MVKTLIYVGSVIAVVLLAACLSANMHATSQDPLTLDQIHADGSTTFLVDHRPDCAWFREMNLPTNRS